MICPICKTQIANESSVEVCPQCGSDLIVHRLLKDVKQDIREIQPTTKEQSTGYSHIVLALLILQVILTFFIALIIAFSVLIYHYSFQQVNTHIIRQESSLKNWSVTGFKELSVMNRVLKQVLTLAALESKENKRLHTKVEMLTIQLSKIKIAELTNQRRKNHALRHRITMLTTEIKNLKEEIKTIPNTTQLP